MKDMSESDGAYTIGHAWAEQNARAKGEPTEAEKEQAKRMARGLFVHPDIRKQREAEEAAITQMRTDLRRRVLGFDPTEVKVTTTRSAKPANMVTKTGEIVENTERMTQAEFDGTKSKHDKLYERDSSGNFVINCAAARTYRQQVWNHFNWRKAELSEQPEHPNVMAVQLAGI
jgi:HSP90 family molecular chaperone